MSKVSMNETQNESAKSTGVKNQLLHDLFQDRELTPFEAYYLKYQIFSNSEYRIHEFYDDVAAAYDIPNELEVREIINTSVFGYTHPLGVHLRLRDYMLDREEV